MAKRNSQSTAIGEETVTSDSCKLVSKVEETDKEDPEPSGLVFLEKNQGMCHYLSIMNGKKHITLYVDGEPVSSHDLPVHNVIRRARHERTALAAEVDIANWAELDCSPDSNLFGDIDEAFDELDQIIEL